MTKRIFAGLLAFLALSIIVFPQGKGQGKGKDKTQGQPAAGSMISLAFSDSDRRMIADYYNPGGKGLPPGLAKRSDLPPGLEKQLRRNGRLPPGLDKKINSFPADLERRFPPLCSGCRRGMLGTSAVILSAAGTILDAFDLASR